MSDSAPCISKQSVVRDDQILSYRGMVYPWHCDQNGHMNVMWYIGKFDEASWSFLAALGLTPPYLRESGCGMVAARQELDYFHEVLAGEVLSITTRLIDAGSKWIQFEHAMARDDGEPVSNCRLKTVHIDRITRRGSLLPEAIQAQCRLRLQD